MLSNSKQLSNCRFNLIPTCIYLLCLSACAPQQQVASHVADNIPAVAAPSTVEAMLTDGKWTRVGDEGMTWSYTTDGKLSVELTSGVTVAMKWEPSGFKNDKKRMFETKEFGRGVTPESNNFSKVEWHFHEGGRSASVKWFLYKNNIIVDSSSHDRKRID